MKNIKKILTLSALLALTLTGCTDNKDKSDCSDGCKIFTTTPIELKIACPNGAPALSLYGHLSEENVEIIAADIVQGYMTDTANKDIVILPTNFGIKQIVTDHVNFKIAATVTFGNFYLLSTGADEDSTLNNGDKVLAFQKPVAGKIFEYVYSDLTLDIVYKANAKLVNDQIIEPTETFDYDYVLLAEPFVSQIINLKENYSVYSNIQEQYALKSGGKSIAQASIFVKNTADQEKAKNVLSTLKKDIDKLLSDSSYLLSATKNLEVPFVTSKIQGTPEFVKSLIDNNNSIGIGYKNAFDNKDNIDAFLQTLGMGQTSEEIYFRA